MLDLMQGGERERYTFLQKEGEEKIERKWKIIF